VTAPGPLKLTIEEARQTYEKAAAELDRICQGPRHGFRMQIPAHPDDSDLVLGEALGALKQLIAERDEAAKLRAAAREYLDLLDETYPAHTEEPTPIGRLMKAEVRLRAVLAASEGTGEP